jgi:tape measure domain-containing protein
MTDRITLGVTLRADGKGLVGEVRLAQRELDKLAQATRKTGNAARTAGGEVDKLANRKRRAATETQRLRTRILGLNGSLSALRSILPTIGLGIFINDTIRAGQEMEKFRALLSPDQFAFVDQQAERLGRSLRSLGNDYAKLTAAAAGTRLEGAQTDEIFLAINESMTALRRSGADVTGALRAIEQMISKGNVQAEELRGQLGERLPGAFHMAAQAMGVTTSQLNKMLERGEVLAEDLLPRLARVLREKYAGELEAAMTSSVAEMERLQTTFFKIQATIAESGFLDGVADSVRSLNEALKSPGAQKAAEQLGAALGEIARNLDLIAVALGGGVLFKLGSLLVGQVGKARQAAAAFGLVRGALALVGGPVGVATLAAGAIYALYRAYQDIEAPTDRLAELQGELNQALRQTPEAAKQAAKNIQQATFDELVSVDVAIAEAKKKLDNVRQHVSKSFIDAEEQRIQKMMDHAEELRRQVIAAKNDVELYTQAAEAGVTFGPGSPALSRGALGRSKREAAEAVAQVDAFIGRLREEADVAGMAARELAGYNAVKKAISDNAVSADDASGIARIRAEALALYDKAKALKDAREAAEEEAEFQREAAQAALDRQAAEEAALAETNRLYEEAQAAKRKALTESAKEISESLESETETVRREYEERLAVIEQAQRNGIKMIGGYDQARERLAKQTAERITEIERAEWEKRHKLLNGFMNEAASGLARYVTDIAYGEREARKVAKSQLNERLRDLEESLADGDIAVEEANERRKELYEDYYDRLHEIDKEAGQRLKDTLVSAFVSAIEEMLKEWIKRGMSRLAIEIAGGNSSGSESTAGSVVNAGIKAAIEKWGGGTSGGTNGSGMGTVAAIGKKVASWFGWGGGSTTSAVPGAVGSVKGPAVLNYGAGAYSSSALGGQSAAAIGNGYGGGAVGGNAAASGAGAGWGAAAGAAFIAAIGVYGFGKQARKQRQRVERQAEFFGQVGTGTSEQLGEGAWDFRGNLNDAEAFFSTTRAGWQSTAKALLEANAASKVWGASLDENGRGLVKIRGDVDQVKTALTNATATGYHFSGSLTNAIEKGNSLRVSILGDADAIKQALNAATASGIGGFVGLQETATGVSATLTGDIQRWDQFLQSFVNGAVRSAISGVGALSREASNATSEFLSLASAASRVRVGSSIGGGRAGQVDGSHRDGLPVVPFDGYIARLHRGEGVLDAVENFEYRRLKSALNRQGAAGSPVPTTAPSSGGDPGLLAGLGEPDSNVILLDVRDHVARLADAFEDSVRDRRASGGGR